MVLGLCYDCQAKSVITCFLEMFGGGMGDLRFTPSTEAASLVNI